MYSVLLFDDRAQVRIPLAQALENKGMVVYSCRSVYEADDIWETKKDELHALVLDMMMPSQGLSPEDRDLTKGGVLTGWFWLWRYLQKEMGSPEGNAMPDPAGGRCVVFYSAYLDDFQDYLKELADGSDEKQFANNVKLIDKGNELFSQPVIDWLCKDKKSCERY